VRPPHVQAFIDRALPYARHASEATGVPVSVVLSQWGVESGWGTNHLSEGNNLGSIAHLGRYVSYPTLDAFIDDWVRVLCLPLYTRVRTAAASGKDPVAVATLLAESPHSESHYREGSHPVGWLLVRVLKDFQLAEFDDAE